MADYCDHPILADNVTLTIKAEKDGSMNARTNTVDRIYIAKDQQLDLAWHQGRVRGSVRPLRLPWQGR